MTAGLRATAHFRSAHWAEPDWNTVSTDPCAAAASPFTLSWGDEPLRLTITVDEERRTRLTGLTPSDGSKPRASSPLPLVEIITLGRSNTSGPRTDDTSLGLDLRYRRHEGRTDGDIRELDVHLVDPDSALEATVSYRTRVDSGVLSSSVRLSHAGDGAAVPVMFVSSFALGDGAWDADQTIVHLADNDWLAESRWRSGTIRDLSQPDVHMAAHGGAAPRGALESIGRGTWSTSGRLPMGALQRPDGGTLLWQIASNGGWRWQLAESPDAEFRGVLRLVTSGPTDTDHNASIVLRAGDVFDTPVTSLSWGWDFEHAVARLTDHRRDERSVYEDNASIPLIYNDYMNTLMADPTTEKLLPLINAAGRVGAEYFIVDAGWYTNEPGWWDTVGAWEPSTTRFPGGITEVFDAIRDAGMRPGLWLEPEVVGVASPIAQQMPHEAFFLRHDERVVDNGRYQLDFRHPAVRERMDGVLDRLIGEFGIRYLKFDYNIDPLAGTDHAASSAGHGLYTAALAFLEWIDALHARHPQVLIENCASGGMRGDWLTSSKFALLSTSDQQDALLVPPISAAAPALVPPEMAGVWSYPDGSMSPGELTVTLANSLLRRPILSGRLDGLTTAQLAVVRDWATLHREIRLAFPAMHSTWPLGLPAWEDQWIAAGLVGETSGYLVVWRRDPASSGSVRIPLTAFGAEIGEGTTIERIFPFESEALWRLDGTGLELSLDAPSAAVFRITPRA